MKDIQKIKIWPLLEKEGFRLKEYRTGKKCFGRGAILQPNYKAGFPFIEIKPLLNGHWSMSMEFDDNGRAVEGSPVMILKEFPKYMDEFKKKSESD
jgi:hypothetical protein